MAYAKISFRTQDHVIQTLALLKRSYCLKNEGNYNKAISVLDNIQPLQLPDSIVYALYYEQILNAYLNQQYELASAKIELLNFYIKDSVKTRSSFLLQALVYNNLYKWDEAEKYLKAWVTDQSYANDSLNKVLAIDKLYKAELPKIKKPYKALSMSSFIPGLGQLYAGYPGEAALSAFICSGLLAGSFYIIIWEKYWITGWLGGLSLFNKFYTGGKLRAEYLAKQRNILEMNEFNHKILRIVEP